MSRLRVLTRERQLWRSGRRYVAGVDEAGRGPLAGPVVAAAVIFPTDVRISGIKDSKKLTRTRREELFLEICDRARSVGVGIVEPLLIDALNIREATLLAMKKAILRLTTQPDYVLVDGNYFRDGIIPYETIVRGDSNCFSIAAASIIAKVVRDRLMEELHPHYPTYGFNQHKGYGTEQHIRAIEMFGLCQIHRRSFHVKRLNR